MNFFKVLALSISLFLFSNYSFSQCFEIESILVDACDNTTDEAYNEMFRMRIGGAPLNTSTLSINWPAQTWLGLVQNATTASKVAQLNADILAAGGCGQILEPTGGVLPANSTVIVVTSPNLDTTLNSFGALTSTIYMIFQNTPAAPNAGHFGNYNATPATRTLAVTFGGGCSDSVTYQRANLVNIFGAVGGSVSDLNGSTVNFTPSGTASYVNNGCTAPIPPFTVEAGTTPIAACPGQIINLTGTAQGQTSVTWTAASGSFSNPNNLATSYTVPLSATSGSSITLTLSATNSCSTTITDNIIINVGGPSLTLASGSNTQSICLGASISTITYTFGGGATGVNVTGLPAGVISTVSGNDVIISGTPTTTTGSPFNYSITTTGGSCGNVTANGTITVSNSGSLNLFCDTGNSTPTSLAFDFSNVGQSSFTYSYTIDGGTPITGTHFAPSNFTVTGLTPGQTVIFTLTANGVSCVPSQTVNCSTSCPSTTLTLTSATGTNTQSTCINTNITPITYTFGNGATGVTVTGLPAGVNHTVSGNTVTISGAPTSTIGSPFSYSITTVGGSCGNATRNGTITVNPSPTLVLNSTAATTNQSICVNTSINPISYTFGGGATGVNITGLPAGVSSIVSGNTVTISGTPTTTTGSPFNYTVTTSGGSCEFISLSGTIAVNPSVSLVLTSATSTTNQIVCANTTIVPINYTIGNGATGYTITGLPAGISHTISGNLITISGIPTGIIGTPYTYTITTNGGCGSQNLSGVLTLTNGTVPVFTQVLPICAGATTSPLPTTSNNGITGTWSPVFNNSATDTYTFTPNSGQCALNTQMTIQITPSPTITNVAFSSNICSGSPTDIVLTSDVLNTTYTWSATISNITGSYVTSGNETNINQIATLTDSETIGTITMVIIPRANGCDGTPRTILITVNPNPVIESVTVADSSVCSATNATNNVHVDIVGNISGITYTWTAITNGVTVVGGVTSGTITATSTTAAFDLQVITSNPLVAGTIYFEVSSIRNGCPGNTLQSGVITVNPNPGLPIPSPIKTICSGEDTDLIVDVSPLIAGTELTWEVLTVVNVSGANPGTGIAPVTINDMLTATTNTQGYVIYRVRSSLGECQGGYTDYRVNVNPAPLPVLTDGNICITADGEVYQTYTLNTGLNDADYDFEWFDTNGNIIPGATSSTLVVDEAGTYSVIATNWLTGCSSDPLLASATATVTETLPATSMTVVQSEYFSDNATITVNVTGGSGTLMYSLDEGSLQSSNVFTGVSAGEHLVTVIDTEGCTFMTQIVTIIDYPNYFTPNGDGIHDTWNISGLNQADAKLYIFDRYGKLIKQLSATDDSEGWDGTYNQELLPSTDYWFSLDYTENGVTKQFKAHFTMKR